jgi:hypothetical protein
MKNVIQKIAADSRLHLDTQKLDREIADAAEGHEKVAFSTGMIRSRSMSCEDSWTAKFKGTPLFAEAVALEEAELASQMKDLQRRMEDRQKEQASDRWLEQDMFCLKKQRLELELAKSENAEVSADDTLAETPAVVPPEEPAAAEPEPVAVPDAAAPGAKTAALLRQKIAWLPGSSVIAAGLGAGKAQDADDDVILGAIRGGAGYGLGSIPGKAVGRGVGGAVGDLANMATKGRLSAAREIGQSIGETLGEVGGGVGGYKLLTRGIDKKKKEKD